MNIQELNKSLRVGTGVWRKLRSVVLRGSGLVASLLIVMSLLSACAGGSALVHEDNAQSVITMNAQQTWHLDKLVNSTQTDVAPQAITSLLQTHLLAHGIESDQTARDTDAYQLEGEVLQWHYHQGGALRPRVELVLNVRNVRSNRIVRTDTLSELGSRRQSLSMLADELLTDYVKALPLQVQPASNAVAVKSDEEPMGYLQALGAALSPSATFAVRTSTSSDADSALGEPLQGVRSLQGRSVAFYYGPNPAIDELSSFDKLILEPDNINATDLEQLIAQGAQTYAYVSVGEVGETRAYARDINSDWILGTNPAWNSKVLDLSNPQLRGFLVRRVGELVERGYHGVFLDTMDSFNIVAKTPEQKSNQKNGLISLIQEFSSAYPGLGIITNRGFEVLDDIAVHVDAVVAESLYSAWNNEAQKYVPVNDNDRQWLLGKLNDVAGRLGLEVIVVDYVAPSERVAARRVAKSIASHGFIPWVANPALDYIGVGALEVVPRKVLMLFDGAEEKLLEQTDIHRYAAMPLEYLGYVPEYLDVSERALPAGVLKGRYAGIVTWAKDPFDVPLFASWLHRHMDDGLPVAFFDQLPVIVDEKLAALMGVASGKLPQASSATVAYMDDMIRPEKSLLQRVDSFPVALTNQRPQNTVHMQYQDRQGTQADVVVTGSFGGFALSPGVVQNGVDYDTYWVVDPFRFIETALQLPRVPQPDVTTENGRRLWLAHIDGDALPSWAEMPGRRLGAEVIYDDILKQYPLPHTVSVVEGEMTGFPAYLDIQARMFDIARRTFSLENVELASHTYSHPFYWSALDEGDRSGRYNLPISGYRYSAEREVAGSIDFINRKLAPPGKQTKVMLWSGDALPTEEELAVADRLGIPNMNGGYTAVTSQMPSMTLVGAMARPVGDYLQVYAPIMNENVYTDDWQGPFDGFRDVIDTLKMTDEPRRLKPINIYYHFYSGTKISAMRALREVYDWTVAQDIYPLYGSDYAVKVPDFRSAGVSRYLDGSWKVSRLGNIRSIRVLGEPRFPQLSDSQGVSGARQLHDGVYLHTDGTDQVLFKSSRNMSARPHLVSSNGRVRYWRASASKLEFRVTAEVPVSIELGGSVPATCVLDTANGVVRGTLVTGNTLRFTFKKKDTGNVTLNCPA